MNFWKSVYFWAPAIMLLWFSSACSTATKSGQPQVPAAPPAVSQPAEKTVSQKTVAKKSVKRSLASALICKMGSDERNAKIESKGVGCAVEYTKFGKNSVVASSSHGQKHCQDAVEHIRKTLTTSGFSCQ